MLPNNNHRNSKTMMYDDDLIGLQERFEQGMLTGSPVESDNSGHESGDDELEMDKRNLWVVFQTAAGSIAHLYREAAWTPFQAAALAVTNLYKESLLFAGKSYDVGKRHGQNKVTRDLLQHLRHSPKKVRRDDVLSVLSSRQRIRPTSNSSSQNINASSSTQPTLAQTLDQEQRDLALFKDAVVSRGLSNDAEISVLGLPRKRVSSMAFPSSSPHRQGGSSPPVTGPGLSPMSDVDFSIADSATQRKRQKPHSHTHSH